MCLWLLLLLLLRLLCILHLFPAQICMQSKCVGCRVDSSITGPALRELQQYRTAYRKKTVEALEALVGVAAIVLARPFANSAFCFCLSSGQAASFLHRLHPFVLTFCCSPGCLHWCCTALFLQLEVAAADGAAVANKVVVLRTALPGDLAAQLLSTPALLQADVAVLQAAAQALKAQPAEGGTASWELTRLLQFIEESKAGAADEGAGGSGS